MWTKCPRCDRDLLVKESSTDRNPWHRFVSCSEDFGGCGYWEWMEDHEKKLLSNKMMGGNQIGGFAPQTPQRNAMWQDVKQWCPKCGQTGNYKASIGGPQSKNPGREYVSCSNWKGAGGCGFFNFTDEPAKFANNLRFLDQPAGAAGEPPAKRQATVAAAVPDAVAIALAELNAKIDRIIDVLARDLGRHEPVTP